MGTKNGQANNVASDTSDLPADKTEEFSDTEILDAGIVKAKTESSDNVGMSSVQFDVEELITELEAESSDKTDKNGRLRKRLDAILERKRRHEELIDFDDYDIGD